MQRDLAWCALRLVILIAAAALPLTAAAQGDGPRAFVLQPMGSMFTPAYLNLSSNLNFSGTILIKDADLASNVVAATYHRFFSLGGRFVQASITPIWGTIGGSVALPPNPLTPPGGINVPTHSGFADPYVQLRVGLTGTPALTISDFAKTPPGFQLYALLGTSPPIGQYDSQRLINLGTNRWAVRLGLPMVIPFGAPASPWILEVAPSVFLYTDNNDPAGAALKREQDPLYVVETHLSHNFSRKFWAGLDLRYQNGGATTTDGVSDDNRLGQLGGGGSIGYSFSPHWSSILSYSEIVAQNDGSHGRLLRFRLVYFLF